MNIFNPELIDMYYKSVGTNSTLILGLTPDTSGLIPDSDRRRLIVFGTEIKSIGQKYIFITDQQINTRKIRIIVDEQFAESVITNFSIHYVKGI